MVSQFLSVLFSAFSGKSPAFFVLFVFLFSLFMQFFFSCRLRSLKVQSEQQSLSSSYILLDRCSQDGGGVAGMLVGQLEFKP